MPIYKDGKEKKDGLQKYRVTVSYKDIYGKYKQSERIAYGMEVAKETERKLNLELKEQKSESRLTVDALFAEYIATKKYEVRESTLQKSIQVLSNHVLPTMKDVKLTDLNMPILQKWKTTIEKKNLSIKMRKNIFKEFSAMINYAVKFSYLQSNPLKIVGSFKDAYEVKKDMDYYTAEEFLMFIKAAYDLAVSKNTITDWDYYVFFNIAFYTGLRKGEIHALKWSDIENNILSVKRSISQKLKGGDVQTPPKNKTSFRSLQLPQTLVRILNEHKQRYSAFDGFNQDYRICGGELPLRDTSIDKRNRKYAELAQIKNIRIHDFRHSHASLLANEGINIQEIARRLGHAKIEITWNTYSHLYPREEERAVKVLDKIQ